MPSIQFKGKSIVQYHHLAVPYRQLLPDAARSVTNGEPPSLKDNLIVHGDNLSALKALLPSFAGRVKCIYIDPPYNTGNEKWVYNDNVNSPMHQEWLGRVVDKENLTRHDKWLCMMWPRLTLLRELLRDDGVIFISIDDNEAHRLRMMLDEVFGEQNFVTTVVWQKNYAPKSSARLFSEDHDYIVVFAKNIAHFRPNMLPRTEAQDAVYENPDDDPRGPWRPNNLAARNFYSKGTYAITCPGGRIIPGPPKGSYWRFSEEKLWEMDRQGRIYWGRDGNSVPAPKIYLSEVMKGRVPQTLWTWREVGHTQDAKKELLSLLDFDSSEDVFVTPKPSGLLERIVGLACDKGDIILDSFAGSGTTAHAVLALNAEDGGNRRFILVEQEDYADSLTAERVRRVIRGVPGAKDAALRDGLGGTFSYVELGEPYDEARLLSGDRLPSYEDLARYTFFTATGEQWDASQMDRARSYLGESARYRVYLLYEPDLDTLKNMPLNLSFVKDTLGETFVRGQDKPRLVIAPLKYLDEEAMAYYGVEYCQLPFGIYKFKA